MNIGCRKIRTHIDFPYHMIDNNKKSSVFNLESFIDKGKVINKIFELL